MMIKVNGEYLDFDDEIEIESQIKLFEEISTANGDFSYTFTLPKTSKNLKALGFPYPDSIKSIYSNVVCEILDDSGFKTNTGTIQIENITDVINCSFFGGNSDWFSLLSEPMSALPLYKYDVDLTVANIQASWLKNSGIVFPILDAGTLVTRSFSNFKVEDFTSAFYVKTLFKEIFNAQGIKLEGDLIDDSLYNKITVLSNAKSQDDVDKRSSYVNKTSAQSTITSLTKITFEDETLFPFFDGTANCFSNSTYTPDIKIRVNINLILKLQIINGSGVAVIYLYVNGAPVESFVVFGANSSEQLTETINLNLNANDTLEVYANINTVTGTPHLNVLANTGSSIKITPTYLYKVFGKSAVPQWTQGEFVSNVMRIFNVLPSFNADNKTLTLNLFNKLKEKTPVDISDCVTINRIDYSEFISDYAKNNYFLYQEGEDEDLRKYNISNFVGYGTGNLQIQNDFIEASADIVESDFTTPITYLNGVFDVSMERFNFVELDEVEDVEITSVTDASGTPRFNITNADDVFVVGDLVRIEDSIASYNGERVVSAVTNTYIVLNGLSYDSSSTGTATLLRHQFTTDDNVYLFVNVDNKQNLFFSSNDTMLIENTEFSTASLAYFNLLSNGRQINTKYKQSLSFGAVNNPLSYQMTILQTYWGIFSQVLADPVLLSVDAYFNKQKYTQLKSFLNPVRIKTNETNNLYYLNRISGYKNGSEACEAELIKL